MKPESNVMEAGKVTAGVKSNKFTKFRITIEPFGFLFVTAIAIQVWYGAKLWHCYINKPSISFP